MKLQKTLSTVASASELIRFPEMHAQSEKRAMQCAKSGVFIGKLHRIPYFLNFDFLINPHIFVCGITGSGKTYLMRSLMLKLSIMLDSLIVLIDFTGEYKNFVELVGEREIGVDDLAKALEVTKQSILYLNMKGLGSEQAKVESADLVLKLVLERMRKRDGSKRVFLFLDEAWKLLGNSRSLQTLLREGRKYRHGLVFSSQLVEDIELPMLSNVATLFVFRLQNKHGLDKLAKNYNLKAKHIELVQKLGVGSCAVIQSGVSGKRDFFLIEKVDGIEIEEFTKIAIGDGMQVEIARSKFENVMKNVCDTDVLSTLTSSSTQNGYVELAELVHTLMCAGVKSRSILAAMRELGIDEDSIADSFALAVSSSRKEHGTRF